MNPVIIWRIVQGVLAALAGAAGIVATHKQMEKSVADKIEKEEARQKEQKDKNEETKES